MQDTSKIFKDIYGNVVDFSKMVGTYEFNFTEDSNNNKANNK